MDAGSDRQRYWSEFRRLDLDRIRQTMKYPLLVDGRNLYDPSEMVAKGFFYQPIGRPTPDAAPHDSATAVAPQAEPALARK